MAGQGLVGRERELAMLRDYRVEAAKGLGQLVVVSGDAGIGKTRLCEELVAHARARGASVAWAACWESGGLPAFWPWSQLLSQIGESLPVPDAAVAAGAIEADAARAVLFERAVDALRVASAVEPRLLVLDDVHWADEATLSLLSFVAPLLPAMPVMIVATRRVEPAGQPAKLDEIERRARVVRLSGLATDAVGELIVGVTGAPTTAAAAGVVHDVTAGNPLFALELVNQLRAEHRLETLAMGDPVAVPPSLRAMQLARLEGLGEPCRELLAIAAVVGDEAEVEMLAAVLELERVEVLERIDEAEGAGVLRALAPSRYGFMHPLLRAALYDDLGAARRVRSHERVGLALENARAQGRPVDPSALAHHFAAAAAAGTADRVVRYATEAGDRALAALAYEAAAAQYERAIAALDAGGTGGDRIRLLLALATARAAVGLPSSRDALLMVAEQARLEQRPEDLAAAALGLAGGTGFEVELFDHTQISLLEEALVALGDTAPALRSQCSARLSVALSWSGADERRTELAQKAVALAREAGDQHALAHALAASCDVYAGPADTVRRLLDASEIVNIARAAGDKHAELLGRRLRLVALAEDGDLAGADSEIASFAKVADELRQPMHRWYVPLWLAMRAATRGELDKAEELALEASEIGSSANSPNAEMLVFAAQFFIHREAAEYEQASALVEGSLPEEMATELAAMVAGCIALSHLGAGRRAQADAVLEREATLIASVPVDSEWLPLLAQLAEATFELGGSPMAPWLYDVLVPFEHIWAVEGIGAYTHGPVARHLGMLAAVLGRPDAAAHHFDNALRTNRGAGASLLEARTLRDWGVALGERGRLAEALEAYRALGIAARVTEVEALLGGPPSRAVPPVTDESDAGIFHRDGDVWAVHYDGRIARVRDSKGIRDLARLVAQPGREIPALDLASGASVAARPPVAGLRAEGDLGETVDATARAAYKERLVDLESELDDADAAGDLARSERLNAEREALLEQLSGAYGLGGRPRRTGDPAERARTAVTARIRDAIRRIEKVHPDLGRHLSRSVRTGTFCVYDP